MGPMRGWPHAGSVVVSGALVVCGPAVASIDGGLDGAVETADGPSPSDAPEVSALARLADDTMAAAIDPSGASLE